MAKNRRETLRVALHGVRSERHSVNPFSTGWFPDVVKKKKRFDLDKKPVFDEQGKRMEGHLVVPFEKDGTRFVKEVHGCLAEQVLLSNTAKKVLLFVKHQALPGNGTVWLPADEGIAFCHFSQKKSFQEGLAELVLYEFIARTEKLGFYFLNQQKFFNGDRRAIKNTFSKPR